MLEVHSSSQEPKIIAISNMKSSYLYAIFLLSLLLIEQPLSTTGINLGPLVKQIVKWGSRKAIKNYWRNELKNISLNSPPPSPNAPPPKQIKGLSLIKDYLSNYGYIQSSGPYDDSFDQETVSAIKTYQKYFNLQVTGDLNNQTLQQISFLRCAAPDINFDYNFTEDNSSWPKAGHRWFPKGKNVTYGFLPQSQIPAHMTKVFKDSFTRWAQASGDSKLNLGETIYGNADIKIGFYNFTYLEIDEELYGASIILLNPDSDNKTAAMLLDGTKFWALPTDNYSLLSWEDGILDLESVAMHQIGHLLGLDHSSMNESVMYPYILPSQQRKVQLSDSDKGNIQHQIANVNSSQGRRLGLRLITTLSLGFAFVLLL